MSFSWHCSLHSNEPQRNQKSVRTRFATIPAMILATWNRVWPSWLNYVLSAGVALLYEQG
jgi:hypothetical protein